MQEATAGNPFFALELGRELVRTGARPAPGQALRVPESLRELLGGRLARLPAEVVDVLLQVAALARPTVELVAATYGDRERVLEALEAAVREGVVELEDSRIRFVHPLVASICYEQAPVWKRRAVHRALGGRGVGCRGARTPSRARGGGARCVRRRGARAGRRASGWARRHDGGCRAVRARRRPDARRPRRGATASPARRTLPPARRRRGSDRRDPAATERRGAFRRRAGRRRLRAGADAARQYARAHRAVQRGACGLRGRRCPRFPHSRGPRRPSPARGRRLALRSPTSGRRWSVPSARAIPRSSPRRSRTRDRPRPITPRSRRACSSAVSRSRSNSGWSSNGTSARATCSDVA